MEAVNTDEGVSDRMRDCVDMKRVAESGLC